MNLEKKIKKYISSFYQIVQIAHTLNAEQILANFEIFNILNFPPLQSLLTRA